MPNALNPDQLFIRRALVIFTVGATLVVLLDLIEDQKLISNLSESVLRLVVWIALSCVFLHGVWSAFERPAIRNVALLYSFLILLWGVHGVVDDIPALNHLPFGNKGRWKHVVDKVLVGGWTCSLAWLFLLVLDSLADANNRLAKARTGTDQLRTELAHVARIHTLGEMGTSMVHELNQPLTAIVAYSAACRDFIQTSSTAEVPGLLEKIETQAKRASTIMSRLRALSDKRLRETEPVEVNDAIRVIVALTQNDATLKGFRVTLDLAQDGPRVQGDAIQIQQVILNLMRNALEAQDHGRPPGPGIWIATSIEESTVRITVDDNGPGVPDSGLEQISDAFFTTKPSGLGLGLGICRTIVNAHDGRMAVRRSPRGGLSVQISLPLLHEPTEAHADVHRPHRRRRVRSA